MSTVTDIDEYRRYVETLATLQSSAVFNNGKAEHAAVIFETFFKHAKVSVNIICKNLCKKVFDLPFVIIAFEEALARNVIVKIICQNQPEAEKFIAAASMADNCHRFELMEGAKSLTENFATMDGRSYRFESNSDKHEAVACMSDSRLAGILDEVFSMYEFKPAYVTR